jgi:hypothetical protein
VPFSDQQHQQQPPSRRQPKASAPARGGFSSPPRHHHRPTPSRLRLGPPMGRQKSHAPFSRILGLIFFLIHAVLIGASRLGRLPRKFDRCGFVRRTTLAARASAGGKYLNRGENSCCGTESVEICSRSTCQFKSLLFSGEVVQMRCIWEQAAVWRQNRPFLNAF